MPSLLRTSDFCCSRKPKKVSVSIEYLISLGVQREDPWSTALVSSKVLAEACILVGNLAVLEYGKHRCVVKLIEDSNLTENVIQVSPTVAASLALIWTMGTCFLKNENNSNNVKINVSLFSYDHVVDRPIPNATIVKLRCLGNPIPFQQWGQLFPSKLSHAINKCPLPAVSRLVQQSSLWVVYDRKENKIYIYEVLDITSTSIISNTAFIKVYRTSPSTKYQLKPRNVVSLSYCRRLPPLTCVEQYQLKVNKENTDQQQMLLSPPPHPNSKKIAQALLISFHSTAPERILPVIGTNHDHHVRIAVHVAANQVGMRCVTISGLASFLDLSPLDARDVTTGSIVDKVAGLKLAIESAKAHAPCVLHICDFDSELSQDKEEREMEEDKLWSVLVNALTPNQSTSLLTEDSWKQSPPLLVVLSTKATLNQPPGPFAKKLVCAPVLCSLPDVAYTQSLWQFNLEKENIGFHICSLLPFDKIEKNLLGKAALDIVVLKETFIKRVLSRDSDMSIDTLHNLFLKLCHQVEENRRRKTCSLVSISNVRWEDIGGLDGVRGEILDAIELPLKYPHLFTSGGRSGILLYGPPGTGKTMVAKAVATECGLPFLSIKGPELLGSYVGESESNIRDVFSKAREAAIKNDPSACVLFFDELDSLAPRRGSGNSGGGVMDRVVATLAAQLDRQPNKGNKTAFIFCMGATNRPDLLDPALLRPGRFDRLVYLGVASSAEKRANIIFAQIRKFKLEPSDTSKASIDPMEVAKRLVKHLPENLTGADLSSIASSALVRATQRLCNKFEEHDHATSLSTFLSAHDESLLQPIVTFEDLLQASKDISPSVNFKELAKYEKIREEFSTKN